MSLSGLGARAALRQKPTKLCERCGLRYAIDEAQCTHCKDISDSELADFKERIEAQHESSANLGYLFLVVALVLGILLFFAF